MHHYIDPDALTDRQRYKLFSGAIVPRPIALITTVSTGGVVNAAPYSFFNILSSDPGVVAVGVEPKPDGTPKDTARNILDTRHFTVNMVSFDMAERMNLCATSLEHEIDELAFSGLTPACGRAVVSPYIVESPAAFECERLVSINVSKSRDIVLGRIVGAHISEGILDTNSFHVDNERLDAVGRIAGGSYATTRDVFVMRAPK